MKRTLLMATLGSFLACGAISGTVSAQSADPAAKPAKKTTTHHAATTADQAKSDLTVKQQPTGPEPSAPTPSGELALGTVKLPKKVTADGKPLAAGTYQVRLTPQTAESKAPAPRPTTNAGWNSCRRARSKAAKWSRSSRRRISARW